MKCSVENCENKYYAKGYCHKHYQRVKNTGSEHGIKPFASLRDRFFAKVMKGDGCWFWAGSHSNVGYGLIHSGGAGGKTLSAHRVSYELHYGPIPDGMIVMHSCDNRGCVNPAHLSAGKQSQNIKDAITRGRKIVPNASGEDNPKSKLTQVQADFIKANPQMQHTYLAKLFGVSPNCIRGVRIGRTWK